MKVLCNPVFLSAEGVQDTELFRSSLFHLCSLSLTLYRAVVLCVSTADLECVPPQETAASFCAFPAEVLVAWKGLTGERSCTLPLSKASGSLRCCPVFSKTFGPLCFLSLACGFLHFSSSCSPTKMWWVLGQEPLSLKFLTHGLLLPPLLASRSPG